MTQTTPSRSSHNRPIASADEQTIRDLLETMNASWNRGDGSGYGSVFTTDADYVAIEGSHYEGRTAITEAHQALFNSHFKGSRLEGELKQIRLLAPDIALVHRVGSLVMPGEPSPTEPASIQTLVAVRQDGAWQFAALQNTDIRRYA
jgi:uncharacterized protein (TIGR02246 family)